MSSDSKDFYGMDFSDFLKCVKPEDFTHVAFDINKQIYKDFKFTTATANKESIKTEDLLRKMREAIDEVEKPAPKQFTDATKRIARTEYFYDWAATRLGVTREIAKSLVHGRLYNTDPRTIAQTLIQYSTLSEVRTSCENYLK